jgi:AcrR family transcriptional regulator
MNQVSTLTRTPRESLTPRGVRTREKLFRAAEAVFAERGFERSSIADIAGRAEVALGTFYVYFPDKKAVFIELVDELGERLREKQRTAVIGATTRIEIERAGLRSFFEFVAQHPGLYRVVREAEFADPPTYRRYYQRIAQGYAAGLDKAMAAGELRALDPECLAYCLMGLADFLGMRWLIWEETKDVDFVVDQAMAFIRHGIEVEKTAGKAPSKKSAPKKKASR